MITRQNTITTAFLLSALMLSDLSAGAASSAQPDPIHLITQALTSKQAQAVQKDWAEHIGFNVVHENSIGMQLRVIPPGKDRRLSSECLGLAREARQPLRVVPGLVS